MFLKSYAKINLHLNIIGKNSDNYHLLDGLFSYINFYDELEISTNSKTIIESNYNIPMEDNIIYKIINKFHDSYQLEKKQNFLIKHQKNIPIGAGLGGGSSNAGVILKFLYNFYSIKESLNNRISLAKSIGADIPFFLTDHSRYIKGIGQILGKNVILPESEILIIKPEQSLNTQEIFKKLTKNNYSGLRKQHPESLINSKIFWDYLKNSNNDLTNAAIEFCPEIKEILNYSKNHPDLIAKMTGTGSTCFLIGKSPSILKKHYQPLKNFFQILT